MAPTSFSGVSCTDESPLTTGQSFGSLSGFESRMARGSFSNVDAPRTNHHFHRVVNWKRLELSGGRSRKTVVEIKALSTVRVFHELSRANGSK